MNKPKRPIICVVSAEANSIEQRQILFGIIEKAQEYGYDTAVLSNIYNPNISINSLECENKIYELVLSEQISAVILISESFVNEQIREAIANSMLTKDVPIIVLGAHLEEFANSKFTFINTSDIDDTVEIIDHLIDEHGLTDIDYLSGYDYLEFSHNRAEGYRQSLRKHGIEVDENKIHFGDFWMTSGEELAKKYVSGALPLPQAVACANDYMAYGLLDEFRRNNIRVPEDVAVIGYEYINQRLMHYPLLTTYQRNRADLGRCAVEMIRDRLDGIKEPEFTPPKGRFIQGDSCPCGKKLDNYFKELDSGALPPVQLVRPDGGGIRRHELPRRNAVVR